MNLNILGWTYEVTYFRGGGSPQELSVPAKTHCSGWMWADFPKNVNRGGSTMIQTTRTLSPPEAKWPQNMVSSISNQFWLLIPSSENSQAPIFISASLQHLSFLATSCCSKPLQPSRGFHTIWGLRKSLRQLVKLQHGEVEQPLRLWCRPERTWQPYVSLCSQQLLISWPVESLEQEVVWHSQWTSLIGIASGTRFQVFGDQDSPSLRWGEGSGNILQFSAFERVRRKHVHLLSLYLWASFSQLLPF